MSFQQDPSGLILRKINTMKKKWIILLDNGHGKETPGKCSPIWQDGTQLREWEYTRRVVRAIQERLTEQGINARIITPEDQDVPLKMRVDRINSIAKIHGKANCLLISVHLNASKETNQAQGWEIHTSKNTTASDRYADIFWDEANRIVGRTSRMRGDYTDGDRDWDTNFYILRHTLCPAVLTENLFMNHEEDCRFLMSEKGFQSIVDIHVNAITHIINS